MNSIRRNGWADFAFEKNETEKQIYILYMEDIKSSTA